MRKTLLFISLPRPGRFGRRLASVIATTIIAMWSIFAGIVHDDYRSSWATARYLGKDVTALVVQDIADVIEAGGLALPATTRGIDRDRTVGGQWSAPAQLDLGPILVLDMHGHVVSDETKRAAIGADLSGLEVFRAQRDGAVSEQPAVGHWTGDDGGVPRLTISRALRDSTGRFDGVAIGSISLDAFRRGLAAIRLPRGSTIALTDGAVTKLLAVAGVDSAATAQSAEHAADLDESQQLTISQPIFARPLTLTLTIPRAQILQHWRSRVLLVGLGFLILTFAVCFLGFTAARELDRRGQAEQQLVELAATDGLTQLANRRRFDEVLNLEWRRAIREGTWISLLMVDGDFFKAFNDSYGHVQGDEALRRIAEALRLCASRPGDLVARIGGEEFVALLPSTDKIGATAIAHAIRQSISALAIPHKESRHGILTVSIGVASRRPSVGADMDLVGAADAALYLAKSRGRHCIVVEEGSERDGASEVA